MFIKTFKLSVVISMMIIFTSTSAIFADIVMFMDNSGSIKKYKQNLHQQIDEIFKMADELEKTIIMIPIGDRDFRNATNSKAARQIFSFDNSYTYIDEAFKKAEQKKIVRPGNTVIIISDMESDLTNTKNDWQLLACDYQDMLQWYQRLIQWMKKDITIHLLLLNAEAIRQFNPKELMSQNVIEVLNKDIAAAKELEKVQKKHGLVQSPSKSEKYNQELIARVVKSLQASMFDQQMHENTQHQISLYPMDIKENIMATLEGIIDPTVINDFNIKIEIDPNVIDLSRPEQRFVKSYLSRNAPQFICNNPNRRANYNIVNGTEYEQHDDDAHYHYKFLSGQYPGFFDALLSNKYIKEYSTIAVNNVPERQRYDIKYSDINDLIFKMLNRFNDLQEYQAKDFPLGKKKILITLKTRYLDFLLNTRLTAKTQNISDIMMQLGDEKILSSRITPSSNNISEGQCSLWVKRQANSLICLSLLSYEKNEKKPDEIPIVIGTIKASQLRGRNNNIVFKDKTDIPSKIVTDVTVMSDEKAKNGIIEIISYDYFEYKVLHDFKISSEKQTIKLLPGSYRYNVRYDALYRDCLNVWFKPFHVDFNETAANVSVPSQLDEPVLNQQSTISAFCSNDQFKDYDNVIQLFKDLINKIHRSLDPDTPLPKLGPNELDGIFKNHLVGSPYFFLRLFQFTADPLNRSNNTELVEMWRRIYWCLYIEQKYGLTMLDEILKPAFIELQFYEQDDIIPKSHIYLKIMLANYCNQKHNEFLYEEEKVAYNDIIDRILTERHGLNPQFTNLLKIR